MTDEVTITGDELIDVLNSTKEIVLDRYVRIRRRYVDLSHEQAKRFASSKHMQIDSFQRGRNRGFTFDDMYQLWLISYDMRVVFNAMDAGATLEQAKEAIDVSVLGGNINTYIKLLGEEHSHEKIVSVARAIVEADVLIPSDVYTLVFSFEVDTDKAIEAVAAQIRPNEYDWAMESGVAHDEVIEVAKLNMSKISDYVAHRLKLNVNHSDALRLIEKQFTS